ncbi:hypothetical protein K491DRAFT_731288 [Lophiostoma macrostomum CBS 122681]|uniref:FAD-binding FR-type domain-containing protein n=1 Tax=Lophiostoma macrostomum CBS 122681 TaxID=1314788 RepID=A0A6A6SV94_9PLEO|nr:hypothetical protein K491DRAFT_731288 [Lophiostoma macrostomum CBS 122681]
MNWPYQFVKLSQEQKHERRQILDQYALYAQFSALFPIAFFVLLRFNRSLLKRIMGEVPTYNAVKTSPVIETKNQSPDSSILVKWRRWRWWLGDDVEIAGRCLGHRGQLLFGGLWAAWLLFLCINETGNDYYHVTKRFGIIGTSQLPLQYLLSSKRLNPAAYAFYTSHETINRWHRTLGWIIYFLVFLHGTFYLNFYIQVGGLGGAFFRTVPALGMLGLLSMTILSTTTLSVLRKYSYRIFYITHVTVGVALPLIIWFHVSHSRVFMAEAFMVPLADLFIRRCYRITVNATIDFVPGTDLVRIVANIPSHKLSQFAAHPASHVFLSIPSRSRPGRNSFSLANLRLGFLSNPFTVASINEELGTITLVARQMKGPVTAALARLASLQAPGSKVALNIDGPYGAAAHFPNMAGTSFDKILLVAGGVGATFIMPLFDSISTENAAAQLELVWAVRDASEVAWPVLATGGTVHDDERIRLFVTSGKEEPEEIAVPSSEEYEDVELNRLKKNNARFTNIPVENHKRPDLQRIVDNLCRQGAYDRIAVIVCGPVQMTRDSRKAVGTWVKRKRNIWFHSETFGW